jgi:two-component sensor histidine kinase
LNHRVKNTLATIQAISAQTLRAARDLPSARVALDRRICSLAQAHDLLTLRAWTGANLTDVVMRALDAFTPAQVKISGSGLEVSPKHALSLSMALHEPATNATKYGALSCPEGRVNVQWGSGEFKAECCNWTGKKAVALRLHRQRRKGLAVGCSKISLFVTWPGTQSSFTMSPGFDVVSPPRFRWHADQPMLAASYL